MRMCGATSPPTSARCRWPSSTTIPSPTCTARSTQDQAHGEQADGPALGGVRQRRPARQQPGRRDPPLPREAARQAPDARGGRSAARRAGARPAGSRHWSADDRGLRHHRAADGRPAQLNLSDALDGPRPRAGRGSWSIPAEWLKNGQAMTVALTDQAVAVLTEWREQCPPGQWVFPSATRRPAI